MAKDRTLFGGTEELAPAPKRAGDIEILIGDTSSASTLLADFPVEKIPGNKPTVFSNKEIEAIVSKVAVFGDLDLRSAYNGIFQLLRKGAASTGALDSMGVEVHNQSTDETRAMTKGDLVTAIARIKAGENPKGPPLIRSFAECIAYLACETAQKQCTKQPSQIEVLQGDLARKINRRLIAKKEAPLTSEEKIWCCSYCQNLADLDTRANSNRLHQLLAEDLEERIENAKKKKALPPKKDNKQKDATTPKGPNQPRAKKLLPGKNTQTQRK